MASDDLRAVGGALHPADAAYLRDELEKMRGISAQLRTEGELSRLLADEEHLNDAAELRTLLLDEADPSQQDGSQARTDRRKPLTAGALVTMTCMVLASRLGSKAGLGVFLGVLLGGLVVLLLRIQDD